MDLVQLASVDQTEIKRELEIFPTEPETTTHSNEQEKFTLKQQNTPDEVISSHVNESLNQSFKSEQESERELITSLEQQPLNALYSHKENDKRLAEAEIVNENAVFDQEISYSLSKNEDIINNLGINRFAQTCFINRFTSTPSLKQDVEVIDLVVTSALARKLKNLFYLAI
jgi:hypothetical protein